jgi:hypothetical protein
VKTLQTARETADAHLKKEGAKIDVSLRGQAMRRALEEKVPKTLTPYEWEEWYALHGVPKVHRQAETHKEKPRWSWRKWFGCSGKS